MTSVSTKHKSSSDVQNIAFCNSFAIIAIDIAADSTATGTGQVPYLPYLLLDLQRVREATLRHR